MGTYVGTFVNLYSTNSYFVYAWLRIVLNNAYIHLLFNPKQISLFCIYSWAMWPRFIVVYVSMEQNTILKADDLRGLLKPSHVMVLKKKPSN